MDKTIFLYKDKQRVPWVNEFKHLYAENLKLQGMDVVFVDDATNIDHGFFLLCDFTEFQKYRNQPNNTVSIMQMNASALNPFVYHITDEEEISTLSLIDINLTGHPVHTNLVKKTYGIDNVYTAGFPVREYKGINPKKKGLFCIGGRLSPDKLVYESIRVSIEHHDFKKLIICYPESSSNLLKYYPKRDFIEYRQCNHSEFLDVLRMSEYYVTSSLGDIGGVSVVEAIRRECKIIAKDYGLPLPYYTRFKQEMHWVDPEKCTERLIKILKEWQNTQ